MSELKKCPFCGQKARERYTQVDLFSCSNINCELCHVVFSADEWNTRPLEDLLTARIAELEGALKKICNYDLKPHENELLYGADELKKIAYEVLK